MLIRLARMRLAQPPPPLPPQTASHPPTPRVAAAVRVPRMAPPAGLSRAPRPRRTSTSSEVPVRNQTPTRHRSSQSRTPGPRLSCPDPSEVSHGRNRSLRRRRPRRRHRVELAARRHYPSPGGVKPGPPAVMSNPAVRLRRGRRIRGVRARAHTAGGKPPAPRRLRRLFSPRASTPGTSPWCAPSSAPGSSPTSPSRRWGDCAAGRMRRE